MKKTLFLTLILSGLSLYIHSQDLLSQPRYMRLVGSIDQQSSMVLHLVKINDTLYGDYTSIIAGKEKANTKSIANPTVQVFGKINPNGKFWLKIWPGDQGIDFKGQFKDDHHITVTMESAAGKGKKTAFDLTENIPEGSIPLKVYHETDEKKLVKSPDSPVGHLDLSLLVPMIADHQTYHLDSVTRNILKSFSETSEYRTDQTSAETTLASLKKEFFDNYYSSNETMYKEMPGASFGWELLKFTHIIYNEDRKLTYYILTYSYTGGAHGLENQIYTSINLETGKPMAMNELFEPGYENKLTVLLTGKLHQMLKLPLSGKLTDSGYFVDEIKPNENFYLNGQGVGFFYNHYEIAPYSFGATDIFLTKEELKGILK
jgi:hypothetical protein